MKKKLTIRIDEAMIERAKRLAATRGKSLSQLVEDYLRVSGDVEGGADTLPPVHPDVLALTGILVGTDLDEGDYRDYLVEKHR